MATILGFECSKCGQKFEPYPAPTICPKDGGPLYVRYDLDEIKWNHSRDSLLGAPKNMWRYAAVLPDAEPVTLGEGFTPMLPSRRYPNLLIKDEGLNPTGSFKARGMAAAITMLKHYGVKKVAAPSAGNAGGAMAIYGAAAGIEAYVFMPKDVPIANRLECEAAGARLTLVDGLISDCGRMVAERKDKEGWFDLSTLKEPFRIEGKKTMGYEVAEQMNWTLPDAILYPTGGGVGLIGMWKAFEEMEALGWIDRGKRPRMICVQADGCAPIPKALRGGRGRIEDVARCAHPGGGAARAQGVRRLHHPRYRAQELRHGHRCQRRRDYGCGERDGDHGRNFPGSRRRSGAGGLPATAGQRLSDRAGQGGAVQHRLGLQVSRCLREVLGRGRIRAATQS